MKSLLISNVFPPHIGGSGRWFWELYRRFPSEDTVIAAGAHPAQNEFDTGHNLGIVRLPLAMPNRGLHHWAALRDYYRNYNQLARLVKRRFIEQIHAGTLLPEGWLALMLHKRFGIPYICYVHGEETNYISQSREFSWMARRILRSVSTVIVNSNNTRRVLRENWNVPDDRIKTIHPGVDIGRFVPAARNTAVRRQLGWDNRTVVLTVGRLQARKGQDHMILALQQVRRAVPDVLYVIVGDGERRQYLEQLVCTHGLQSNVQFRGEARDSDLLSCYQQSDLFALPNREVDGDFEGFGMVLIEAQACGRPVLAGCSGGTAETMQVPETGRLVCCDRPALLAETVIEMLSDRVKLEQMGRSAREWVVKHFDWEALTMQARAVFESLVLPGTRPKRNEQTSAVVAFPEAVVGQK